MSILRKNDKANVTSYKKKHQNVSLTYEIKEDNYRSIVRVDTLFDND